MPDALVDTLLQIWRYQREEVERLERELSRARTRFYQLNRELAEAKAVALAKVRPDPYVRVEAGPEIR